MNRLKSLFCILTAAALIVDPSCFRSLAFGAASPWATAKADVFFAAVPPPGEAFHGPMNRASAVKQTRAVSLARPRVTLFSPGQPLHGWSVTAEATTISVIIISSLSILPCLFHPSSASVKIFDHIAGIPIAYIAIYFIMPVLHRLLFRPDSQLTVDYLAEDFTILPIGEFVFVYIGYFLHDNFPDAIYATTLNIDLGAMAGAKWIWSVLNNADRDRYHPQPITIGTYIQWIFMGIVVGGFTEFLDPDGVGDHIQTFKTMVTQVVHWGPGHLHFSPNLLSQTSVWPPLVGAIFFTAISYAAFERSGRTPNDEMAEDFSMEGVTLVSFIMASLFIHFLSEGLYSEAALPTIQNITVSLVTVITFARLAVFAVSRTARRSNFSWRWRLTFHASVFTVLAQWWFGFADRPLEWLGHLLAPIAAWLPWVAVLFAIAGIVKMNRVYRASDKILKAA